MARVPYLDKSDLVVANQMFSIMGNRRRAYGLALQGGTFFTGARAVLEQRMSQAASAVASAIVSAWEQGGKPTLPLGGTDAAGGRR